ncbi:DUF424 domain-containing protein [Halovivax limisalsi]|uniref:DUF424 domain-containing protein n=1 Tax=Halovivax limisalsi TaxID=1453760 RepID=UPI001FFC6C75|nr:DUF424 family protein [Halovivax limisalsi]
MILTERRTPKGVLVAACDTEVLGETFEADGISLTVTEEFYGSDPVDLATARDALARADVANLVGHLAIEVAVDVGIVDEANVLEVGETVHAQALRM